MAQVVLGRVQLLLGDVDGGLEHFRAALALAERQRDDLATTIALHHVGWAHLLKGEVGEATTTIERSLGLSERLGHDDGITYGVEGFIGICALRGDVERAGLLAGAAQSMRERIGLFNPAEFTFQAQVIAEIRAGDGAALFDRAFEKGRRLTPAEAVAIAREAAAAVRAGAAVPPSGLGGPA
jgi:hypothetical protein